MNRIFLFILISFCVYGCRKNEMTTYESVDRINFTHSYYNAAGVAVESDSVVYSFGQQLPEVTQDTARIPVELVGRVSDRVRYYRVVVADSGEMVKGKTTMVAGEDYEVFPELQAFRANKFTDTLKVVVFRKNLDPSTSRRISKHLMLRMESCDDFQIGFKDSQEERLAVNDFLPEPIWWQNCVAQLHFYHPEKWRLLISWDSRFADREIQKVPYSELLTYEKVLISYLTDNKVIDQETGKRISMDGLVPNN